MTAETPPKGQSRGYCARCGTWPAVGRLVRVIEKASGAGPAIVEPEGGCASHRKADR